MTQALTRVLTCGEEFVAARVEELVASARERDRELKKLRVEQAVVSARAAAQRGTKTAQATIVRGESEGAGADYLKAFAEEAVAAPGRVVIAIDRSESGFQWIVAHSLGPGLELPAVVTPLLAAAEAKGGGRAAWMQGMGRRLEAASSFAGSVEEALTKALG